MYNSKFIVYINGQSTKPLLHTLEEVKQYATRHIEYKPFLRIECYTTPYQVRKWTYDYQIEDWVEQL